MVRRLLRGRMRALWRLLAWRADVFDDYDEETFEAELKRHFVITATERLPESTRTLHSFRANGGAA